MAPSFAWDGISAQVNLPCGSNTAIPIENNGYKFYGFNTQQRYHRDHLKHSSNGKVLNKSIPVDSSQTKQVSSNHMYSNALSSRGPQLPGNFEQRRYSPQSGYD